MEELIVLALPRGGVPVGYEVALALQSPLDVFIVRKLGMPRNPELAMGAIASGGACLLNQPLIRQFAISPELLQSVIKKETVALKEREVAYGTRLRAEDFTRKTALLVDDGAATGATMTVAVQSLRKRPVTRIVVALPTASTEAADQLRKDADEVIALIESDDFHSVGQWYWHFDQTTDEEVIEYLQKAGRAINPVHKD